MRELQKVKGIGPTKARAIITWRKRYGPFRRVDDLSRVPGFGEKLLNHLKPQLKVERVVTSPPTLYPIEKR